MKYDKNSDKYNSSSKKFLDVDLPQQKINMSPPSSLCSKDNKNNCLNDKDDKGFFQNKVRTLLEGGRIYEAMEEVRNYVNLANTKFYRFRDLLTNRIIIAKQLNRFDSEYICQTRKKLEGVKKIGVCDILHITLTVEQDICENYVENFQQLKKATHRFIEKFKYLENLTEINYISTYECTNDISKKYHHHIHLLIFNQASILRENLDKLKTFWYNQTGGKYIFLKVISKDRNFRAYNYVIKYIQKEVGSINLTSTILFSVKGKAYSMSHPLADLIRNTAIEIGQQTMTYINSFQKENIFSGYTPYEYNQLSLTWFFTFFSKVEKEAIYEEYYAREKKRIKDIDAEKYRKEIVCEKIYRTQTQEYMNEGDNDE
ncbi:MAG: hypothetical protein BWK75_04690 [Candidatus Altiarchaeales archaeon A3]|nr:MAG: hypothetical protein BWK75_04690 [Candidatus Altiarchaeales archaeon A3]